MKKNEDRANELHYSIVNEENNDLEGYPVYPENEDIYHKFKKEKSIDPENITKSKDKIVLIKDNEKDFNDDVTGSDLDIPGSDIDETEEIVGQEDEENNYFSLGGDDHNDLEEDLGY